MIKKAILYPFLFILYGILNPLLVNLDQIDPAQAIRPLVLLALASVAAIFSLSLVLKDRQYAGYLIFLGLAFLFFSGHTSRLIQDLTPGYIELARIIGAVFWGIGFAFLGIRRVWLRLGGQRVITPLLNLVMTFALASATLTALPKLTHAKIALPASAGEEIIPKTGGSISFDCKNRPDIYYLILDAYGRADVLEELYGLDNGPFLEFLEGKGFTVASEGHTNYTQTIYSLASSLNFRFIEPEPTGVSGQAYFTQLIAENEMMALLNECGYQTVAFETGFSFTNHPQVDLYMASENRFNEFESLLLVDTPVEGLAELLRWEEPEYSYESHRERVLDVFDQLSRIPAMDGPKFVFAHIISPHPPFVFDRNGSAIQPGRSYSIGDGNDFRGTFEEYRAGYAGQVQFINQLLEKTIEDILAESQSPPVIILQGDHGPGSMLDWSSPEKTCLLERTSIFNAYYLPGGEDALYPSITPVNSFRVVLNTYFGTELELLPDNTYFTSHYLRRQVIDITGDRSSEQNCRGRD